MAGDDVGTSVLSLPTKMLGALQWPLIAMCNPANEAEMNHLSFCFWIELEVDCEPMGKAYCMNCCGTSSDSEVW